MRIFLDANILFSAAKSSGAISAFLAGLKDAGHTLVADGYVIAEASRNIEAKFPTALPFLKTFLKSIETSTTTSGSLAPEILPDLSEKDRPVVAAALRYRCEILLTGDKTHFGMFYEKTIDGLQIHSPASLAKLTF